MRVRLETPGEVAAIRIVEEIAFGRREEAQLVDDLRAAGDAVFSLVAVDDGIVAGHAMFSRMKAPFPALALGPVAVLPECRRTGIASELIREGIARSEAAGRAAVFVLRPTPPSIGVLDSMLGKARGFISPYAGPHLMVRPVGGSEFAITAGPIEYAPAFASLE